MRKVKKYKVLRDLPNISEDKILTLSKNGNYYCCQDNKGLPASLNIKLVENNPDWFELVNDTVTERIEVMVARQYSGNLEILFKGNYKPTQDKLPAIKKAVDDVINGKGEGVNMKEFIDGYQMGYKTALKYAPEQPSNDNAFVWTPELINEFMNEGEVNYYDWLPAIKRFQLSEQNISIHDTKEDKPDWEIKKLSTSGVGGVDEIFGYHELYENEIKSGRFKIHSVRRISDNCLFTVGDEESFVGKITAINIDAKYAGGIGLVGGDKTRGIETAVKLPSQPLPTDTDKPLTGDNLLSSESRAFYAGVDGKYKTFTDYKQANLNK